MVLATKGRVAMKDPKNEDQQGVMYDARNAEGQTH
jgi:hypothetical protein